MQSVLSTNTEDGAIPVMQAKTLIAEEGKTSRQLGSSGAALGNSEQDQEQADPWEDTSSIYEEYLDDVEPFPYDSDQKQCTAQEAKQYRRRLHQVGLEKFVDETLVENKITVKKLCSAFGVLIPSWLQNESDESCYKLLGLAMLRELKKRQKIPQFTTIDDAAKLLAESKNILVITGAGISTSLGIPDFRSKSTGFYSKLRSMGYQQPEEVFDLANFDENPEVFYSLAGDILPDIDRWTPTHQFIRMVQDKGKLLRNYTQNIDNIETFAGVLPEKLIQCHGSWATATCRKCARKVAGDEIFGDIRAKKVARCQNCAADLLNVKPSTKRKRSSNVVSKSKKRQNTSDDDDSDGQYDIPQPGIMKPDITFFGEMLPDTFFDTLQEKDRLTVDLIIVIGTSMKVAPVAEIPGLVPPTVPQIYISRDPIHHINFDINLLGDCDVVVAELCRRAGWELRHEMIRLNETVAIEEHETLEDVYTVRAQASA